MIPLSSQLPQLTVLIGVIVYLANGFLGADLTSDQVTTFVQALCEVVVAVSAVWSWFNARQLVTTNVLLNQKVSALSAQVALAKPVAKPKAKRK